MANGSHARQLEVWRCRRCKSVRYVHGTNGQHRPTRCLRCGKGKMKRFS